MKPHQYIKPILSLTLSTSLIFSQVNLALAYDIPTPPTPPPAPDTQPETPEIPDVPDAPTPPPTPQNPLATPTPEPTPAPQEPILQLEDTPQPSPTPAPATSDTHDTASFPADSTSSDTNQTPPAETPDSSASNQTTSTNDPQIVTGDSDVSASITNDLNNNLQVNDPNDSPGSTTIVNQDNGAGSTNDSSANIIDATTAVQNNAANIVNNLNAESDTGHNEADKNLGDTNIETGDANVSGSIVNSINTNVEGVMLSEFNIADDQVGDYLLDFAANCVWGCGTNSTTIENTANGAESINNAELTDINSQVTFQTNDATVENNLVLLADSGHNSADKNTNGDVNIKTGDANVSANVVTLANNNFAGEVYYGVVNIYGDLVGDIIFPEELLTTVANTANGAGSTNTSTLTDISSDQTFQTNDATINNHIDIDANTGGNDLNKNTGGSSTVETGDTNVDAQVLNIANTNLDGENMWLVLVNEAGNWIGKIFGAPAGALFAGSENADFTVNEHGEVTVTNQGNGADSTNDSSVTQINSDTLVQTNTATIDNNLHLGANTGGNSAGKNTGGNSLIETGDANIIANLVNFVNNNITGGGKLFVTMVNVFGSWTGNFLSPGIKPQTQASASPEPEYLASPGSNPAIGGFPAETTVVDESPVDTASTQSEFQVPLTTTSPTFPFLTRQTSLTDSSNEPTAQSDSTPQTPPSILGASETDSSDHVIHINLAWLLSLLPISGVYVLIRKLILLA